MTERVAGDRDPALTALVLSDLHCTTEAPSDTSPSSLTTRPGRAEIRDPFDDLRAALGGAKVTHLDLVLCPGDLTDKADPDALVYAWRRLNELAKEFGARLLATAGNHDMDSRGEHDVDPRAQLVELEPPFPVGDEVQRERYWTYDYAVAAGNRYRVLVLNSCAMHGYGGEPEFERGRFRRRLGSRLRSELTMRDPPEVSIVLVHHHLAQLPNLDLNDSSVIVDAQELVDVLSRTGSWLVVHGHKHRPYILNAAGGGSAPVVFAAGSFAARPYGDVQTRARNQVYLLEFAGEAQLAALDLPLAVRFMSWTWDAVTGWATAAPWPRDGLPAKGGLGCHTSPHVLARRIATLLEENNGAVEEAQLRLALPRLDYVSPPDLEVLREVLDRLSIELRLSGEGLALGAFERPAAGDHAQTPATGEGG